MLRHALLASAAALAGLASPAAAQVGPYSGAPVLSGQATRPLLPPAYDDFSGSAATINGRAMPQGGLSWATSMSGAAGNVNALAVDGSGHLNGGQGTQPTWGIALVSPSIKTTQWTTWHTTPTATDAAVAANGSTNSFWTEQATYVGCGTGWNRLLINSNGRSYGLNKDPSGGGNQAACGTAALGSGAGMVGTGAMTNVIIRAGDVYQSRLHGADFVETYLNGHKIMTSQRLSDFTSGSGWVNHKVGVGGGQSASGTLDDFETGDPDTQAMITVVGARVPQINADGSLDYHLAGEYTLGTPLTPFRFTLYSAATGVAVGGYVSQPVTSFNAANGHWTGLAHVAQADLPAAPYLQIDRTDLVSGAAHTWTTVARPGLVFGCYGQSLCTRFWGPSGAVTGVTITTPAKAWLTDGSGESGAPSIPEDYRTRLMTADDQGVRSDQYFTQIFDGLMGAGTYNIAFLRGGRGATAYSDRRPVLPTNPVYGIWPAFASGVELAGNNVSMIADIGGQNEAGLTFDATAAAAMISDIQQAYNALDAQTGSANTILMVPLGAWGTTGSTDQTWEDVRRTQWELTQLYPARYVMGPFTLDILHTDGFHPTGAGNGGFVEMGRRMAFSWAYFLGAISNSHQGPSIAGFTRTDDHTLVVKVAKNGATSVSLDNTAYTGVVAGGDFRGGLTFSTVAGTFALSNTASSTNKLPTSGSCADDGGDPTHYANCTFGFAAASFPGTAYMRGPWGANPFNRMRDATVQANMYTDASMIRGTYAAINSQPETYPIPIQPWWNPAHLGILDNTADYWSAS